MANRKRHVVFATDARGVDFFLVALDSLLRHADRTKSMTVHVLEVGGEFEETVKKRICAIADGRDFAAIEFHDVAPQYQRYGELIGTRSVWARFFFADFIDDPGVNVLYIDTDVLITDDLGELFDLELGNNLFGAVSEVHYVSGEKKWHSAEFMPAGAWRYFNAGVMVINLDLYRREKIHEKCFNWYNQHRNIADCFDQDSLNVIGAGRVFYLPPKWNFKDSWLLRQMQESLNVDYWRGNRPADVYSAIENPKIIHYVGPCKPWKPGHRPERHRYHDAMRLIGMTPPRDPISACFYDILYFCLRKIIIPIRRRMIANKI